MNPTGSLPRWRRVNSLAGTVVFAVPAAVSAAAIGATLSRFGPAAAISAAIPICLLGIVPILLWHRYLRRNPTSLASRIGWGVLGLVVVAMLVSPLTWWSAPTLLLIISEAIRVGRVRARHRRETATAGVTG